MVTDPVERSGAKPYSSTVPLQRGAAEGLAGAADGRRSSWPIQVASGAPLRAGSARLAAGPRAGSARARLARTGTGRSVRAFMVSGGQDVQARRLVRGCSPNRLW